MPLFPIPTCVFVPLATTAHQFHGETATSTCDFHLSQSANTSFLGSARSIHSFTHSLTHPFTRSLTSSIIHNLQSLHRPRNHRLNHQISSLPGPSRPSGPCLSNYLVDEWQLTHPTATLLVSLDNLINCLTQDDLVVPLLNPSVASLVLPHLFLWVVQRIPKLSRYIHSAIIPIPIPVPTDNRQPHSTCSSPLQFSNRPLAVKSC